MAPDELTRYVGFVEGRPAPGIVAVAVVVPVVRVLVHIERAVAVPEVAPVPPFRRRVDVPAARIPVGPIRIELVREIQVILADVAAIVACCRQESVNVVSSVPQSAVRPVIAAVRRHTVRFRITSGEQHAAKRTAYRRRGRGPRQHKRFARKRVQAGVTTGSLPPRRSPCKPRLIPEPQRLDPELVREDKDQVGPVTHDW